MTLVRLLPRFRRAYRALPELERREGWSRAEIEAHQLERLNALWAHAVAHVPYYRRLADGLPPRFASVAEFRQAVPLLPKAAVRAEPKSFLSDRAEPGHWARTGGSTGTPMSNYWATRAHQASLHAKYRFCAAWGIDVFDRMAFLWGHSASLKRGLPGLVARCRMPVEDRLRNRIRLSAYTLGRDDLAGYLRRIIAFRPAALYGYSRALGLLAAEAAALGVRVDSLAAVILTGEPAFPHLVKEMEAAFGVPAVIEYGSVECGFLAGEAPDRTLRVREDRVLMEALPRDDGRFDIVVTVLDNPSFPLIRYAIADVTEAPLDFPGRGFAVLAGVGGRDNDLVISRSGRRLHSGRLDAMFKYEVRGVRRFRVHQRADGSLSAALEMNDATAALDTAALERRLTDLLEGYPARVEVVAAVPQTAAGKHRLVTSDLDPARARPGPAQGGGAEGEFYESYPWCLNPFLTVRETAAHLSRELDRLGRDGEPWQARERMTNVYLLACSLLNSADEYLLGTTLRLPKKLAGLPLVRPVRRLTEKAAALLGARRRARVRRWREAWVAALEPFLPAFLGEGAPDTSVLAAAARGLADALRSPLPDDLLGQNGYFPSAFRKHDLTHHDVSALGRRLVERFPERERPILVVGLRTAGSFFAPLLRTLLKAEGYRTVDFLTVRPDRGTATGERAELARCAAAGYLAVVLDDSPRTGDALAQGAAAVRGAGFPADRVTALVPVHPAMRDWRRHAEALSLGDTLVLTLEPEDWHKRRLLSPDVITARLAECYGARGFSGVRLVESAEADRLSAELDLRAEEPRRARLKRVYEVRLEGPDGRTQTRRVLVKSVGWGWLGYHAFLTGQRLAGRVPPVLGLRDGFLFTEWVPDMSADGPSEEARERWVQAAASYVAARARSLSLCPNPNPRLGLHRHHEGFRVLERALSRAYGGAVVGSLMRDRVRRRLASAPCPFPALIDAKMQRDEWIDGPGGWLKTDHEHHGLGKNELNVIDPAHDLAEAILEFALSPEEEGRLVRRYADESGDAGVAERLLLHKLAAGTWAMAQARKYLFREPPLPARQQEFGRQLLRAWHFLTVHAARFCGDFCRPSAAPSWRSPLVVLDVDGVLDRRVLGFPCTTGAGIEALALLHAHDFTVALDTARSADEVKEYCRAYGLAGGVAEYGSYAWDAVNDRGRVLVSDESLAQLDRLRDALGQLPGVFVDDRYRYSVRACTYEETERRRGTLPFLSALRSLGSDQAHPVPLPALAVRHLVVSLGLDRLTVRQTGVDTTVTAREVDKGTGLSFLLNWVGLADADTSAVGDSEPDLPMFRVARRAFAPAQIDCGRVARSLGCRVARRPYQRGLLGVARELAHADGR
ncbi:MAG TPA: HAD hydrolase family protein, partial [Gemmataceae bacterium]|nr:HAD hydrolase family protein [Gemmataceae bacterium]